MQRHQNKTEEENITYLMLLKAVVVESTPQTLQAVISFFWNLSTS